MASGSPKNSPGCSFCCGLVFCKLKIASKLILAVKAQASVSDRSDKILCFIGLTLRHTGRPNLSGVDKPEEMDGGPASRFYCGRTTCSEKFSHLCQPMGLLSTKHVTHKWAWPEAQIEIWRQTSALRSLNSPKESKLQPAWRRVSRV